MLMAARATKSWRKIITRNEREPQRKRLDVASGFRFETEACVEQFYFKKQWAQRIDEPNGKVRFAGLGSSIRWENLNCWRKINFSNFSEPGRLSDVMHPNLIILAGGISSRMKKAGPASQDLDPALRRDAEQKAKAMIGVGENFRLFLDYLLYNIAVAGYRNVVIVVGEKDDSIREYYDGGAGAAQIHGLKLSYAIQPVPPGRHKPLGTADALWHGLKAAPRWRGQSFTVCNSDNLYTATALRLLLEDTHENAMIDYDRAALQFAPERISQFAVIKKNTAGFLLDIIEKPSPAAIAAAADGHGRLGVSMNIFRLSYDRIFPCLEAVPLHPVRQEKELPAAVKMRIDQNPFAVFAIPRAEHVPDLTRQADILPVQEYLKMINW
jgi:glucose-1-phosphate adenylyltransferase